jgi:hypothetical protein
MRLNIHVNIDQFDALFFNEHWLNDKDLKCIKLDQFILASYFCRTNHIHGGAAIYIKNGIRYKEKSELCVLCEEIHFEICAIEILDSNSIFSGPMKSS